MTTGTSGSTTAECRVRVTPESARRRRRCGIVEVARGRRREHVAAHLLAVQRGANLPSWTSSTVSAAFRAAGITASVSSASWWADHCRTSFGVRRRRPVKSSTAPAGVPGRRRTLPHVRTVVTRLPP